IVDGGLLSNFPVDIFDSEGAPAWPTFGFHLVPHLPVQSHPQDPITGPVSMLKSLVSTMLTAHDTRYLDAHAFVRTIPIDTLGVSAVRSHRDAAQKPALYESGRAAAKHFLSRWDFQKYKAMSRAGSSPTRRDTFWSPPRA